MVGQSSVKRNAFKDFAAAWKAWLFAFAYLRKQRLQAYHWVGPSAILMITWGGWVFSEAIRQAASGQLLKGLTHFGFDAVSLEQSDSWASSTALWAVSQMEWILEWGIVLLMFWVKLKITKYLLLTLVAPFMSLLAATIRFRETGQSSPLTASGLIRDVMRGLRTALSLFLFELSLTIALAISGLLLLLLAPPIAAILSPVLVALSWAVGSYFYGAAVFDAVFEQQGINWRSSLREGWNRKGHLMGIGTVFSLLMAIPLIGPIVAALIGPIPCTAAAAKLTFSSAPSRTP